MNHKMFLAVLLFLCSSFFANAQINKGSVLLGGQISNNTSISKTDGQKEQQYNAAVYNVSVGKAIKENTVVGINLNYSPSTNHNYTSNGSGTIGETKIRGYSAGVYYRLYKNLGKDFYFFGEFGATYMGTKFTTFDSQGNELNSSSAAGGRLSLSPGLSYKLMNKFYLEVTIPSLVNIQYTVTKSKPSPPVSKQEQFTFNTALTSNALNLLGVGFCVIL